MKNMTVGISLPLEKYIGKWQVIFNKNIPDLLFHYTNLSGIVGITESRQFWLSKIKYLNDYSEVNFFIRRLKQIMEHLPLFEISDKPLQELQRIINTMPSNYYIGSFSKNGDLLSQWRGYTENATGISIGFNTTKLNELATNNDLYLMKCIYDQSQQDEIAISIILDSLKKLEENDEKEIRKNIALASLACKSLAFSEEEEWRLILIDEDTHSNENFGVKARDTQLVPYYKLNLPDWTQKGIIEQCYIGPNSSFNEIEEGLRKLISTHICHEFSICESSITYR